MLSIFSLTFYYHHLLHICKTLHRFGEIFNCFICPMLNPVPHSMLYVAFQYDLPDFVQSGFDGIDLRKDILIGNVFIYHSSNRLNLANLFCLIFDKHFPNPRIVS